MLDQTLFMWWDVNFLFDISWVGLKWSCCLYGLCKWGPNWLTCLLPHCCPCQHPCGAMSSPLSTSLPCQQLCHRPRQITYHHCHPCHRHVKSHVILHANDVWHGNWIHDENYTGCDVYFHHRKWACVGLWRPGDILWRFQNVMDQTICDEILRNVTRCNLWCSINDAIWDRYRYCFMTGF